MSQIQAARDTSQRLVRQLRSELAGFRVVLVEPRMQTPRQTAPPAPGPKSIRRSRPQPKPLSVPDTRLLDRLAPQLAGFVKENPTVESVLTREIVRDLDNHVLDPRKLLERSSLRVSFELDESGNVSHPRVEKSSGVPSIDHMALELCRTLGDYQLPYVMKDIRQITISIDIGEDIEIRVEGALRKPEDIEQVQKQVQNALALLRFVVGADDGAFILQEVTVGAEKGKITLTRRMPKEPALAFLSKYYSNEAK